MIKINLTADQVMIIEALINGEIEAAPDEIMGTRYGHALQHINEKLKEISRGGELLLSETEGESLKFLLRETIETLKDLHRREEEEEMRKTIEEDILNFQSIIRSIPVGIPEWIRDELDKAEQKEMQTKDLITIAIPKNWFTKIGYLVRKGIFKSKKEFILKAIEELLRKYESRI